MDAVRVASLGQISEAFFEVGGQYRRSVRPLATQPAQADAVSCDALRRDAEGARAVGHVPVDEQVEEQASSPPRTYLSPEELDRQRLLSITSAGRVRPD